MKQQESSKKKNTRDLPNLTECHACGFRIDTCTTAKNHQMQTLYSEWRIVLLCNKCFSGVESSQICSYCFKDSSSNSNSNSNSNCFRCFQCHHSVHKNCYFKHKSFAPWSYSSFSVPEFSLCVDCWVPKPIANKRGLPDANCVAEKKAEAAVKAREIAVKKALLAKRAVEFASNALDLAVAKKDTEIDDAKLAFQLHRAINSSPRILRNSSCTLNGELFASVSASTNVNVDCLKPGGGRVYLRKRRKDGNCRSKFDGEIAIVKWGMMEGEESCSNKLISSSVDDNSMNSESRSCNGERCDRYLLKYRKRKSSSKGVPNSESKLLYQGLLPLNCSNESRASSNAALQSCALSLQPSASYDQS